MKISKDKRNKLIVVAAATVAIIFVLWYMLICSQNTGIRELSKKIAAAEDKEHHVQMAIKSSDKIQAELNGVNKEMAVIEREMASGDLYSWMYNTIKDFKASHRVDIPQFSGIDPPAECNLMYKFPFKQIRMTVNGSGYFHDIGKFVADFENHFPHIRIQNLELTPASGQGSGDREREKLAFRIEVIALVKSPENK
jgi:Tfp pilus assembly protein PilO